MQLEQNYFQLFDLPESYHVDQLQLSDRYRSLQKQLHPDRFAHAGEREQLRAVQYTAHVNEALNTLKTPIKRAQYLVQLRGREACPESGGRIDPQFLIQQMELRERLEQVKQHADPEAELELMQRELESAWNALEQQFVEALEDSAATATDLAVELVGKMQFLDKLSHEIELAEDQLTDY